MQKQERWDHSLASDSARTCSRRCSPSPGTYCSPRQEEGTSLTSAGSWSSVQPSGVFTWSEHGTTEISMGIPPSLGSLVIKNKTHKKLLLRDENHMIKQTKMAKDLFLFNIVYCLKSLPPKE